jgi:D-beta-D-heptose 7-phosphate kinase/D-beta-D-heptose 1-phosphate adenosyltransferase
MRIVKRSEIRNILAPLKKQGKRIVFTNGCFDILHIGHIRYLKEAKKLGDILVIGLNSDKSVSRIKPERPIMPEDQRAEVLSSLYMVDYIVIFDEDTPYELIQDIQPDVLVKGADWKRDEIVGADIVKETYTIPIIEGVSTSKIIERIKHISQT